MGVAGRRAMAFVVAVGLVMVAVGLVMVAVAACGASPGGGSAGGAGSLVGGGPQAFAARARTVVAQWNRSPAARVWRTGLVLLSPDELTSIPRDAGFANQHQKEAFGAGRFTLAGRLPSAPLAGRVRRAGGAAITVPLLTAQATFRQLATNQACAIAPCGHFTVTAAQPADFTIATNRGLATVPAWRFTVAELPFPVTRAAIAPTTYSSLPASAGYRAGILPGGASVAAVADGGRALTLSISTGACVSGWGGRVYSTATALVVGSWSRDSSGSGSCPASALMRQVQVRLSQPLGTRVILDAGTGFPVVPGLAG